MELKIGDKAPDFELMSDKESLIKLSDYRGNIVILYFYPKDNTPGWTNEASQFAKHINEINELGAVVLGVSKDNVKSHKKFVEKLDIPFLLLSDEDKVVCNSYGVLKEKNMFGKISLGIERSTFIIDKEGKISNIYRKVKVENHVEEVINFIRGHLI